MASVGFVACSLFGKARVHYTVWFLFLLNLLGFVHDSCTWRTLFGGTGIFIYVLKVFLCEIRDQVVYIGRFVSFYTPFFKISIRRYLAVNCILVAVKTCLCSSVLWHNAIWKVGATDAERILPRYSPEEGGSRLCSYESRTTYPGRWDDD
jgi:hypothetical protein